MDPSSYGQYNKAISPYEASSHYDLLYQEAASHQLSIKKPILSSGSTSPLRTGTKRRAEATSTSRD